MAYQTILFEKEEHVGVVTINRPEARNSVSLALMEEIIDCFEKMDQDKDIRAVVITGGPKVFSAGFDMPMAISLGSDPALKSYMIETADKLTNRILKFRAPVIAAVSGAAMGAGFDLQVFADIRVYSETATLGQLEINVAVTPLVDPLWKIIGLGRAKELMMSGRMYGAEEAYRMGLANFVYPVDTFLMEAKKLARKIARFDPEVMEVIKEESNRLPGMEVEQAIRSHLWSFRHFVGGPAMVARMTAFLEKEAK